MTAPPDRLTLAEMQRRASAESGVKVRAIRSRFSGGAEGPVPRVQVKIGPVVAELWPDGGWRWGWAWASVGATSHPSLLECLVAARRPVAGLVARVDAGIVQLVNRPEAWGAVKEASAKADAFEVAGREAPKDE